MSFFEYRPEVWQESPDFMQEFTALMAELGELSDRLADAEIESQLSENGFLEATASWPSGRVEKIRVNTNRFEQDGMSELEIQDSSLEPTQLVGPDVGQSESRPPVLLGTNELQCQPCAPAPPVLSSCIPTFCRCARIWTASRHTCYPSATACRTNRHLVSENRKPRWRSFFRR